MQVGPVFAGSRDVGGAGADMIVGDLLLEVKASANATIKREVLYGEAAAVVTWDSPAGKRRYLLRVSPLADDEDQAFVTRAIRDHRRSGGAVLAAARFTGVCLGLHRVV